MMQSWSYRVRIKGDIESDTVDARTKAEATLKILQSYKPYKVIILSLRGMKRKVKTIGT